MNMNYVFEMNAYMDYVLNEYEMEFEIRMRYILK